jgi:nitrate/nitrite transporter NarK
MILWARFSFIPDDSMNKRALMTACATGLAFSANYTNHAPMAGVLRAQFSLSQAQVGLLATGIFTTHALMQIPGGWLADRFGSLRILIFALAWVALANIGLALSVSFEQLLLLKAVAGLGTGTSFAAGARYTVSSFQGRILHLAQGFYGGSVLLGAGFILFCVPVMLETVGWHGAFVGCALIAFVAFLYCLLGAPRPQIISAPPAQFAAMLSHSELWLLGLVQMASFGLAIVISTWITTLLRTTLDMPLRTAGLLGSLVLLLGIITRPLGGWLALRVDLLILVRRALLLNAGACVVLALSHSFWLTLAAIIALALGCGVPYAGCFNRAAALFPGRAGAAMGLVNMIGIVMILGGAPAIGWLADVTGSFRSSFVALAVFAILAALSIPLLQEKDPSLP